MRRKISAKRIYIFSVKEFANFFEKINCLHKCNWKKEIAFFWLKIYFEDPIKKILRKIQRVLDATKYFLRLCYKLGSHCRRKS